MYTYDQAVIEYGPPDKSAKLSDNSTVAEWLTNRGWQQGAVFYTGPYPGPYRSAYGRVHYYNTYPTTDSYLRLVFGPDGKLNSWQRFAK